jgi:hypothetical protein
MTRPKNPNAAEKEARIQEAITAVLNDEYTCHSAAIAFNAPSELYTTASKETKSHAIKPMNAIRT